MELEYEAARTFLMKNPETHQRFMDLAGEQLDKKAGFREKVILAAKIAGLDRDAA